jgi:hypothetical protein
MQAIVDPAEPLEFIYGLMSKKRLWT